MPCLNNLATEMLCKISNFATDSVDDGIINPTTVGAWSDGVQVAAGGIPTWGVTSWLKTTILAALTLSHVCKRWHKIVLGPPAMWQRVRISYRQLLGLGNIFRDIITLARLFPTSRRVFA